MTADEVARSAGTALAAPRHCETRPWRTRPQRERPRRTRRGDRRPLPRGSTLRARSSWRSSSPSPARPPARRSAARARRFFLSVSAKRPPRERSDPPSLPPSLSPPRGPPSDLTRVPRPAHLDHRQARTCSRRTKTTRRRPRPPSSRRTSSPSRTRRASAGKFTSGAFYTLVPIRPRWRGERRFLRTLPGVSLRPPPAFNPRPRCLSTPTDAFQLHPDIRLYGTTLSFCTK